MKTGNLLLVAGGILILVGFIWNLGLKPFHLPGDIIINKNHLKVYIPITTMLLLSLFFSLGLLLYRFF